MTHSWIRKPFQIDLSQADPHLDEKSLVNEDVEFDPHFFLPIFRFHLALYNRVNQDQMLTLVDLFRKVF